METKFKIGDVVWQARYGVTESKVPCPVCYGKRVVKIILGNDDVVETECGYCSCGYEGPRGFITEHRTEPTAQFRSIDGVEIFESSNGATVRYRDGGYVFDEEDLFATKEEAMVQAEILAAEHAEKEATRAEYIKKDKLKTFSWNAGYHMREAKRNRKDAEYHERKAVLCKARAKE